MPKMSAEYVIGEGDGLSINVIGGGTLNDALATVRVGNGGTIQIPFLGEMKVAGLTAEQLEQEITRRLTERDLLKNPDVLVYISDYKAKPFFVIGEVDNPGEYMMSQELTLMEAILMAGGIDPTADSMAYLYRRRFPAENEGRITVPADPEHPDASLEMIKIDIAPLKVGGVPETDILIRKGDTLLIPRAKDLRVFVVGDVRTPGGINIPWPPERTFYVSQAIAQAGGPNRTAKISEGLLVRYREDGSQEQVKVDFMAILRGRQPDVSIKPNDIIYIPSSNAKTMAYGTLGLLPMQMQQRAQQATAAGSTAAAAAGAQAK